MATDIGKYLKIYHFHSSRSKFFALKMIINTFREIDLFDMVRRVNTRSIRKANLGSMDYMWYSPVYSGVAREMISAAVDFYNSAVKYSNYTQSKVFLDLGGGSGKPSLLACENGSFSKVISVDIDAYLADRAKHNFSTKGRYKHAVSVLGNVEDRNLLCSIFRELSTELGKDYSLFVFNKNSYGQRAIKSTLQIIKDYGPENVIYLYQNPVHRQTVLSFGYMEFQRDAQPNNAHKNLKYILFWK